MTDFRSIAEQVVRDYDCAATDSDKENVLVNADEDLAVMEEIIKMLLETRSRPGDTYHINHET